MAPIPDKRRFPRDTRRYAEIPRQNYANSRVPALRPHKRTALQPSFSLLRGHSAFLNTVSGAVMTTRVLSATDPVRNALPPTTECSPITVSPPRMEAPE